MDAARGSAHKAALASTVLVVLGGMLLIEMPAKQATTDCAKQGAEGVATERFAQNCTASTASDQSSGATKSAADVAVLTLDVTCIATADPALCNKLLPLAQKLCSSHASGSPHVRLSQARSDIWERR